MSSGLPIPSCGWRTGPQLGPDTDLAVATGNNKQDKPGQSGEYSGDIYSIGANNQCLALSVYNILLLVQY